MWDYTDKVVDHFKNPRNVGSVEDPDGVGVVGSLACGDTLKLSFKLDDNKEKITDIKFQTFGCASAIASSSALTELAKGKTLEEASKITNKEIADYLGGLPDQKLHCSILGKDALIEAIKNYTEKTDPESVATLTHNCCGDERICDCMGTTRNEFLKIINDHNVKTFDELAEYTKAGSVCGKCRTRIKDLGVS